MIRCVPLAACSQCQWFITLADPPEADQWHQILDLPFNSCVIEHQPALVMLFVTRRSEGIFMPLAPLSKMPKSALFGPSFIAVPS